MSYDTLFKAPENNTKLDEMYLYAEALAKVAPISFLHCTQEDKFYVYNNGVWTSKHDNLLLGDFSYIMPKLRCFSINARRRVLDNLKILKPFDLSQFNSDGFLNFQNGMFNPLTKEFNTHNPEHYSTIQLDYAYDETKKCPLWLKVLDEICEGNKDKMTLLKEFFGYCLMPDVKMKKALLLLGESNSGKSTILFLLRWMLGEKNCSSVPLKYMGHPQYMPMMINKLANIDADISKNAQDFEAEFKIITSGEPITCNQKFIETFEFIPTCKIVLAANIFPRITDHSSAFYNRLILIPCDRVFNENEQDKDLKYKLKEELPGILNWAVEGLEKLKRNNKFSEFDFMKDAVQELEDDNNPSNIFFKEHIRVRHGSFIEKGFVFDKYVDWCAKTKTLALNRARFATAFYRKFSRNTPKDTQENGKRVWRNLEYVYDSTETQSAGWTND